MTSTTQLSTAGESAGAPGGKPAKKSKKKLVIILVPLLLLGAVGYLMFGKGGSKVPPKPVPGVVVPLEPITINLSGGHFLKLGIALQATKTASEELDGSHALDLAIDIFSNRSMEELGTNKGRTKYKEELIEQVVEAYEKEVMDVYFTEFVTQ